MIIDNTYFPSYYPQYGAYFNDNLMLDVTYEQSINPEQVIFDWTIKSEVSYLISSRHRVRLRVHLLPHLVSRHDVPLQQREKEGPEANGLIPAAKVGPENLPRQSQLKTQI
jgi:hypothetical protein